MGHPAIRSLNPKARLSGGTAYAWSSMSHMMTKAALDIAIASIEMAAILMGQLSAFP